MIYVVGSGPAGVSCAMALLQKGAKVTLLDVGLELEPERADQLNKLRNLDSKNWLPADLTFLKEELSASTKGIPLKLAYGSEFPYRDPGVDWLLGNQGVATRPSFAKGGLSTVWGAAVLPYREDDLRGWPISECDLSPHYRAVLGFVPLSSREDSLEKLFPLHSDRPQCLKLSSQGRDFLESLDASAEELRGRGIFYGGSRLAVWAQSGHSLPGCCYCAQCMYGCPYEVIYGSAHTLGLLCQYPNFTYRNNVVVDRLVEHGDQVTVFVHDINTRESSELHGSRVYLACGVLATTKILLESLEAFDQEVTLQDCYYFLLPLLRFRRSLGASQERLHTLSQVFLEIMDGKVSDKTVHLQVYTYNELYSIALKGVLGPAYRLMAAPMKMLIERLLLIQGYLPSEYSPSMRAMLCRDSDGGHSTLQLSTVQCENTAPMLKRVLGKLTSCCRLLGAVPVLPMLRTNQPGRGFHTGATFPMKARPGHLQSDVWGRPYGFNRVHAVDASVFPNIPATTITLSVMANAHRIGSGLGDY